MSAIRDEWTTEDGSIRLLLGDCLEILPQIGKVDACVTDPPYGLGDKWDGGAGGLKSRWKFPASEAKAWDMQTASGVDSLAEFSEAIIWGGNYYALPPSRGWLIWNKKQPDTWTTGQCELAWSNLDIPTRRFDFAQCELANEGEKFHPTQKPIALMLWCLKWVESQTILDPFMGSGTTGVACIRLNRRFVGIEREPKYFEIAKKRIQNELAKTALIETPKKLVQTSFMEAVS